MHSILLANAKVMIISWQKHFSTNKYQTSIDLVAVCAYRLKRSS